MLSRFCHQTPDPSVLESSIPTGHHDDHEATPTPKTNNIDRTLESEGLNTQESEGLNSHVEGDKVGENTEISGNGVKDDLSVEPGDRGVKDDSTQSEIAIQVVTETPEAMLSELSRTIGEGVREGRGGGGEEEGGREGGGGGVEDDGTMERGGEGKGGEKEGRQEGGGRRRRDIREEREREGERWSLVTMLS